MMADQDNGFREAQGTASKGVGAAGKAKGAAAKGQAVGGKLFVPLLVILLIGVALGAMSLIDPFAPGAIHIPRVMLVVSALGSLAIGIHLAYRHGRIADDERRFWPELGVVALATLALGIGMALAHAFLPGLLNGLLKTRGSDVFTWVIAPTAVALLLPTLLVWAFRAAMAFEPRRYELWHYPKNYREQQHTWNRDRIVIANFHFKRKEQEDITTTVNVKLPEDAELGELAYLFIKDYNENRFPNTPITSLRNDDGSLGWVFRKPRYVLRKQRKWTWKEDVLDPRLTIAQNGITRDSDVYFQRVFQENQRP